VRLLAIALTLSLGIACTKSAIDTGVDDTDSTGPTGPGLLVIDPCDAVEDDFGTVEIGSISTKTLRAANIGGEDVVIEAVSIDLPFSHSAATPVTVGPESTNQFSVRFQPTNFGAFSSDLVIEWSEGGVAKTPFVCTFSGLVTGDADGDGFNSPQAGGADCDDHDASVHPGAADAWYDGDDTNCDGADDYDQDGDGFEASLYSDDPDTGNDCQDADPDIHPGASDVWYDGLDSDCDGRNDFDVDGDGYSASEWGGTDCDDGDPAIVPDAREVLDGVDNDCDGTVDIESTVDVHYAVLVDTDVRHRAGYALATGDFDSNGRADLAVGIPAGGTASVAVFMDGGFADGDDVERPDNLIAGTGLLGSAVADLGDIDGDGFPDLGLGATTDASSGGAVYVMSGKDVATATIADATLTIQGGDQARLGTGLGTRVDLDGDGLSDVLAWGQHKSRAESTLAIEYGGVTGVVAWADLDATLLHACGPAGPHKSCGSGTDPAGGSEPWARNAATGHDFDGDGYADVLLADPEDDTNGAQSGAVWILWGKNLRYNGSDTIGGSATTLALGEFGLRELGAVAGSTGDVDGDGADEVWATMGLTGDLYRLDGGPALRNGGFDLATDAGAVVALGPDRPSTFADIGDWSGDGIGDIALGFGTEGQGYVRLIEAGGWQGAVSERTAELGSLRAGVTNDSLGLGIPARAGDFDHDGLPDLTVGDPDSLDAVWVFTHP
jgi:hypothetical protein